MCLSIPSKVVKIDKNNLATVESLGVFREVTLDLMQEDVKVGDYVLIHVGYAMGKIDENSALETLKLYEQMLEEMDKQENETP